MSNKANKRAFWQGLPTFSLVCNLSRQTPRTEATVHRGTAACPKAHVQPSRPALSRGTRMMVC